MSSKRKSSVEENSEPSAKKIKKEAAPAPAQPAAAKGRVKLSGEEKDDGDIVDKKGLHQKKKVIIVLERAALETVKTKKGIELITADTHASILKKLKKNPQEYRPDILHQVLLTLLDSPLNKAGHLQVYIQTMNNVLIEVSPHIRIPRTFKRFAGLMVQLLYKLKIRSSDGPEILLKVIKNPVTQYFPPGAKKFGTSVKGTLTDVNRFVPTLSDEPVVFSYGSHAHGPAEVDWTEQTLSFSQYPLSASVALSRLMHAFEAKWEII